METKHTPTPWTIIDADSSWNLFGGSQHVAKIGKARNGLTDAAYIVRAVNAHEELLQFAKNVEAYLAGLGTSRDDAECVLLNYAEQAIAKAERK